MSTDLALVPQFPALPVVPESITEAALAQKQGALAASALIGKVTKREENDAANEARKRLKQLANGFDKARKKETDKFVEAQRAYIRLVEPHIDELNREDARLEMLMVEFKRAEDRRVRDEQLAQERELARIEAERQAELKRIADEQARIEREAREAREAAERLAQEATNKKQREAAEKARLEAVEKDRLAREAAAIAAQQTARVEENADLRARIESKPVEITRSAGQTNRKVWIIKQINDFQLMKARPDLVRKIEWDMVGIKEILNAGGSLPGVTAVEDLAISTRGRAMKTIEV